MIKYLIGAVVGGAVGFFVLYRLIGCSSETCFITANPYLSTIYGIILGVVIAGVIAPKNNVDNNLNNYPQATAVEYRRITAEEAKTRIESGDSVIILDVRTEEEYMTGHIPDAILIPNETIGDKKPELLPELDMEILIYCRSGNRSAQAAIKLISLGYTKVYDFGGIIDWPYGTITGK